MRAGIWLETFPTVHLNSFKSKESFQRWAEAPRVVGGRSPGQPGPAKAPKTRARCAFRRRAARTSRSASPEPSPAHCPPPRAEKPPNSGMEPTPGFRCTPRPALPALPGHLRDGRRKRLLR